MAHADPFSMSTMLNALNHLHVADPIHVEAPATPPPGFDRHLCDLLPSFYGGFYAAALTHQALEMPRTFNIMTKNEEAAEFKEMISNLNPRELQCMASMLTSDSDYFMAIARNKNGSKRIQMLFGKSDDVDSFSAAIMRNFFPP